MNSLNFFRNVPAVSEILIKLDGPLLFHGLLPYESVDSLHLNHPHSNIFIYH